MALRNNFKATKKFLIAKFDSTNKGISTMVNSTLLNFGMRYPDNLRVIFDQWLKLHLSLDALSNQNGSLHTYSIGLL